MTVFNYIRLTFAISRLYKMACTQSTGFSIMTMFLAYVSSSDAAFRTAPMCEDPAEQSFVVLLDSICFLAGIDHGPRGSCPSISGGYMRVTGTPPLTINQNFMHGFIMQRD